MKTTDITSKTAAATKPVWVLNVVSSNIRKASYNFKKHKLLIEFKSGNKYVYDNVSVREFLDFSMADSHGKWFQENIKGQKPHRKR